MNESGITTRYRQTLFSRIVPTIEAIGLFGPRVRRAWEQMGLLGFAGADLELLRDEDRRIVAAAGTELGA
jgi:hypothetical protein